jgi:hypothetical protein
MIHAAGTGEKRKNSLFAIMGFKVNVTLFSVTNSKIVKGTAYLMQSNYWEIFIFREANNRRRN